MAISYEYYKRLLAEGQKYVQQAQLNDPEWQEWSRIAGMYTPDMGGAPPSPTKDYWAQYMEQLGPQTASEFQKHMADSKSWGDQVGSVLKYAIPAAVGGIGLAGAGGLLAGTELGAMAGFPASGSIFGGAGAATGGLSAADIAMAEAMSEGVGGGAAALGGGTSGIGTLGSAGAGVSALPPLESIGGPIGTGTVSGAMGGTLPPLSSLGGAAAAGGGLLDSLGSAGSAVGSALGGLGSAVGGLGGLGSLVTAGAGLANSLKDPETAKAPDYMALAKLQAQLDQDAADKALAANRPDQVDSAGNSLTWSQDPVTGKWTQTQKLSSGNQALLDTSQSAQLDALRGVQDQGDFNYQGGSVMDPTGNATEIQNAWMNLLQPQRDQARASEIQRLKNQGLTEDSPAFQRAMLTLGQADTDAQNKALIAGTGEYGNRFNRSLQSRQQGFGEYQTDYNQPMRQYQGLMGIAAPSGQFGSFTNAQNPGGANVYGAGQDQYATNLGAANAKNAQSNNLTQGLFGLSGSIAKNGWGG